MKGRISSLVRRLTVSKRVAAAAILCGLVGMIPYLARTQAQNEIEEGQQETPLTGVTTSTQNPLQIAILRWYDANLTTRFIVGLITEPVKSQAEPLLPLKALVASASNCSQFTMPRPPRP